MESNNQEQNLFSVLEHSDAANQLKEILSSSTNPNVQKAISLFMSGDYSQADLIIQELRSSPASAKIIQELQRLQ